jgi:hypothetical protein
VNKFSQCSCCERTFLVVSEEVLYCSKKCKDDHNLFKQNEFKIYKKKPGTKPSKNRSLSL